MRAVVSVMLVVLQSSAHAQPASQQGQPAPQAQPAPGRPYPQAQPYPQGQPYPPATYPPPVVVPYPYVPVGLTPDEQKLLAEGEMPDGRYLGGAIASMFFGLGVGQAVQGRYGETGWIFTLGEVGSAALFIVGVAQTFNDCYFEAGCAHASTAGPFLAGGFIGLLGFRVWEVLDAFIVPARRNARVRALRVRLGLPPPMYSRVQPYVAPTLSHDGGATAGLTFRF